MPAVLLGYWMLHLGLQTITYKNKAWKHIPKWAAIASILRTGQHKTGKQVISVLYCFCWAVPVEFHNISRICLVWWFLFVSILYLFCWLAYRTEPVMVACCRCGWLEYDISNWTDDVLRLRPVTLRAMYKLPLSWVRRVSCPVSKKDSRPRPGCRRVGVGTRPKSLVQVIQVGSKGVACSQQGMNILLACWSAVGIPVSVSSRCSVVRRVAYLGR